MGHGAARNVNPVEHLLEGAAPVVGLEVYARLTNGVDAAAVQFVDADAGAAAILDTLLLFEARYRRSAKPPTAT